MDIYGLNIIADLLGKRYDSVVNVIGKGKFSKQSYYHEIARIMDLGRSFLIYAFIQKNRSLENFFNKFIVQTLSSSYFGFTTRKDIGNKVEIKNFTAIVILKLKHQFFIL